MAERSFFHRMRRSRFTAASASFTLLGSIGLTAAGAAPDPLSGAPDPLPIHEVVLFSSGVGYFQRSGSVDGAATVPLSFPTGAVQDILKSLILIDPAGKVEPVTYTSEEPLARTLQSFGIDVSGNVSMSGLLEQLRGVLVRIVTKAPNPETIEGSVLSVETHNIRHGDDAGAITEDVSSVNLVTDTGIRNIKLSDIATLTIQDPTLAAQLKQALKLLANGHDEQQKTVTLHFGAGGDRTVQAGYVTEAPVWKTSYRLALDEAAKPYMQGWAVVDNTTEHDWNGVRLTLVSGQPVSFLQNLYTPLYIPRPVVEPETQYNPYPQLSEDNVMENARAALQQSGATAGLAGGGFGGGAASSVHARASAASKYLQQQQATNGPVAAAPEASTPAPSDRDEQLDLSHSGVNTAAAGQQAGELFEYRIKGPVSIPRKQSAMIPIVTDSVTAEKLDLFDADKDPQNPRNALELTNTTGLHLKAGPMTVFDAGSYAGDARVPELEPGETRLMSYAVDLGITAVRANPGNFTHLMSLAIRHGVLNMTYRSEAVTNYTLKSKLDRDRTVMVEQALKDDSWKLTEPAKPDEKTRSYYRFRVPVPAGKSAAFKTVEDRTDVQTLGLLDADINTVLQWRTNSLASPALQAALQDIAQKKQHLANLQAQAAAQKARLDSISAQQDRIRQNMGQLDHESNLYKRYVAELDDQETQIAKIRAEIDRLQGEISAAHDDLDQTVGKLDIA